MYEKIRSVRRRTVKNSGRFLLQTLAGFIGRQSLIGDQPVFDRSVFPWIAELESHWQEIRAELDRVLESRDELPSFHQVSPYQKRISTGDNWKTFVLYVFGDRFDPNCQRCPSTARELERIPNLRNAGFSILAPHYHIPPHRGPTNGIVRIHLALKIPKDSENCWIRVDDQILHWKQGECMVFDDFYEHEVQNNTDEERVVLFFDVDRPMRLPGRLLTRSLINGFKHSSYVKDPKKNLQEWERSR
jgi:aspartyl/asparaginyl beta-hydroxylase (cupin superfamily)